MPIISTADEEVLMNQGLLSPANSDGVRRIHKRRLNRSSDEENQHLPLSPVSVASSQSDSNIYSIIPEELVSLATIKYLGYNNEKAAEIWNKWTAQAPGDPVPESIPLPPFELRFIDYVVGYSYGHHYELDADGDDDSKWHEVMDRCGINMNTQRAIMDPVFRQVRLTETCQFWIRDTVESRYEALEEVQEASQEREQAIRRAALRPGGSGFGSRGISSGGTGRRSISESIRVTPGMSQHTAMSEAALRAANAPGTITLFRGSDKSKLNKLFDDNGNLDNIQTLLSRPPTDFCGREIGYYFAVDRDIAMKYATFARRRSDSSSIVMVHATFQNSTIEGLSEGEIQRVYWPSEEWKRLIFLSRKAQRLPPDLRKFKQAALVIGTIAGKPNKVYVNMDHYTEIAEECVYKNGAGRNAVQYVFRNEEGEELLEKAEIKVFSITTAEFNEWHRKAREES